MRILLISRCPPWPLHLGDRLIVYHLMEELEARGHTLDLIALYNRSTDPDERDHYKRWLQHLDLIPEPRRTQFSYLQRLLLPSTRFPTRAEDSWSPALWQAIENRLNTTPYDAIHLIGGIHVYEVFQALKGQPTVITPYESYSLYLERAAAQADGLLARMQLRIQQALAAYYESFMFILYSAVTVVSDVDAAMLRRLQPRLPVQVIPNGVDTLYFRPRTVQRVLALIFTGNYEYAPNVDAALRLAQQIFPRIQAAIPNVRLWLVGHAPPPEMQALANDSIRVTGRVSDVRPYLARAGCFVSPLRLGAGIKNKVLEALAMGCPVVATPMSVDGIAVQEGQSVLLAEDESALAEASIRVLQDSSFQQQLGQHGRQLIDAHYSWGAVAEQVEQVYRSLLTPTASAPHTSPD
jgi:glycosyltransferase involved in cell wall biosynthesis